MKKGDKRIRVDVLKKTEVDGKEVKVKVGEKDIYETNRFSGSGAFNMSWDARNKMPRPGSKRQRKLRGEDVSPKTKWEDTQPTKTII
jgi:hypothetical protein